MLFILYPRTPFFINIIAGPTISYVSMVMNIVVFFALFDKRVKTPSTVVMQGLAIADCFTALFTYGFEPLLYSHYTDLFSDDNVEEEIPSNRQFMEHVRALLHVKYPYCVLHYCTTQLAEFCHLASVLLTSFLGLQKLLAVTCPFWSRVNINVKKSVIGCCVCFLVSTSIHIPRMLAVRLTSVEDTCLIVPPYERLEKYVLTYYPILYSVILTCAAIVMIISTGFIIFTLCSRKRMWKHSSSAKYEKKSCVLISCVVVVFLLSEVPRLFLNTMLFDTYKSDMNVKDAVFEKVTKEINRDWAICDLGFDKDLDNALNKSELIRNPLCEKISAEEYKASEVTMAAWRNQDYLNAAKNISFVMNTLRENTLKRYDLLTIKPQIFRSLKIVKIIQCYNLPWIFFSGLAKEYRNCTTLASRPAIENYNSLILGSSPYSEPLNYVLNIIWKRMDISLGHLKLFMEIIKLSTVIACASNFIIYIAMSEKLRNALLRKVKIRYKETTTSLEISKLSRT